MLHSQFESAFPRLRRTGFEITSPMDPTYNCIAWAAGDSSRWWQPVPIGGYYWPPDAATEMTIDAYTEAYRSVGYESCSDGDLDPSLEKIALFALNGEPTHAARQLRSGQWTSKCGRDHDISHIAARDVGGTSYGEIVSFMARPWPDAH